jgi:hypothetical protein
MMSEPRPECRLPTPSSALLPRLLRIGQSPLVGRDHLLSVLGEYWAQARAGGSSMGASVVLLCGAPGIGKSRLLEEFAASHPAVSGMILRGGASNAQAMPPYLPFLQALGDYMAKAPPDELRDQVGAHASTLATLFRELSERLGPLPPPYRLSPEQERYRLYEAVTRFWLQSARVAHWRCFSMTYSGPMRLVVICLYTPRVAYVPRRCSL